MAGLGQAHSELPPTLPPWAQLPRISQCGRVRVTLGAVCALWPPALRVTAHVLWVVSLGGGQEGQGPNLSCQVGPDTRGACELEAPHEPSLVGTHLGVKRTTDGSP